MVMSGRPRSVSGARTGSQSLTLEAELPIYEPRPLLYQRYTVQSSCNPHEQRIVGTLTYTMSIRVPYHDYPSDAEKYAEVGPAYFSATNVRHSALAPLSLFRLIAILQAWFLLVSNLALGSCVCFEILLLGICTQSQSS